MHWALALVIALPLLAWGLSRLVVHGTFAGHWWMRRKQYEKWHGKYYEFATVQLRAAELDDGRLVFNESDLLRVIEQPQSTTVKLFGPAERVRLEDSGETALTQAGCERLLIKCPNRDAKKLLLFLQRECFKPHAKKRENVPA